ncbi:hypothetical protein N1937_16555 [Rhizobium sp. WSM4643]|nr:hypothetical protein [Rhizobium leguminosarum]UWM74311.1 hypothetical protein N1937_16555 [Rhizobium leguminosarum bv. viciae]
MPEQARPDKPMPGWNVIRAFLGVVVSRLAESLEAIYLVADS